MEINIWGWLWSEDDSGLLLRQRLPEVCVFRGCRLDGWYGSDTQGLVVRRKKDVSPSQLLGPLLAAAGCVEAEDGVPVAILRRLAAPEHGPADAFEAPQARLLTAQELRVLLQRTQEGAAEAEVWSVQSYIEPADDTRYISVYHCDAAGEEKSDIFGRAFHRVYSVGGAPSVTSPLEVATERTSPLSAPRLTAIEAKTLNVVRFASRFHNLDFEGLVLEFIFDPLGRPVLHGCWCSTLFGPEARRRVRPGSAGRARGPQRMFPVPVVGGERSTYLPEPPWPEDTRSEGLAASCGSGAPPVRRAPETAEGCTVLLELWRGDQFLGEALLPTCSPSSSSSSAPADTRLQLGPTFNGPVVRVDGRKAAGAAAAVQGHVVAGIEWSGTNWAEPSMLNVKLRYAEGLAPASDDSGKGVGLRALLWLRRRGSAEFSALWTSREAPPQETPRGPSGQGAGTSAVWNEHVDLTLSSMAPEGAGLNASVRSTSRRLLDPAAELGIDRGGIEFQTCLRSTRENVCGAELVAHWGMAEDGTMRTHVLASQVHQRLSGCRTSRSSMLSQIAGQLQQLHEFQLAWDDEVAHAKSHVAAMDVDIRVFLTTLNRLRQESREAVEAGERRLVTTCRDLSVGIEALKENESSTCAQLEPSQKRVAELRSMVHRTTEKNSSLQATIDKTAQKFDELSSTYAKLQAELARARVMRPKADSELEDVRVKVQAASREVERGEHDLAGARSQLEHVREDLARERAHTLRLEDFIRRLATAPSTRMRTGGGYAVDNTAKQDAAALLQEIAAG